jgi:predicted alpha/beta superfamily hydrolase
MAEEDAAAGWGPYEGEAEGTVRVLAGVESPELGGRRDVLVHLPPSYEGTSRRYPVLYMHDGQNLFDPAEAFGASWRVDRTLQAAAREGLEAIVVAVPNAGEARLDEYSPWRDRRHGAGGRGAAYVEFLARTLKPRIDGELRTLPGREATGIAGSSMGGLISLWAYFRHPSIFGFAGVMSPALWFAGRSVFPFVSERPFSPGRLYLDIGTNEGREALNDVRRMKDVLARKGYQPGRELLYVVEMGGRHDERAWARRLRRALHFLLGVPPREAAPRPRGAELL